MLSARMIDAIIATIIIVNGLNAVANTGPFRRMHNPCTKYAIPDPTTPCTQQILMEVLSNFKLANSNLKKNFQAS